MAFKNFINNLTGVETEDDDIEKEINANNDKYMV